MNDRTEFERTADYWGNMPPDDVQEKGSTFAGLAGASDQARLDAERDAMLIADLRELVKGLEGHRDSLIADLRRVSRTRKRCAKHLREAREKNRKLWLRLDKLAGRGQTGEG